MTLCQVSPVKVGGKPGFPVTVGGIPHPMTELMIENQMTLKKANIRYLVTAVELPESSNQDAIRAIQFDKKMMPHHQI